MEQGLNVESTDQEYEKKLDLVQQSYHEIHVLIHKTLENLRQRVKSPYDKLIGGRGSGWGRPQNKSNPKNVHVVCL